MRKCLCSTKHQTWHKAKEWKIFFSWLLSSRLHKTDLWNREAGSCKPLSPLPIPWKLTGWSIKPFKDFTIKSFWMLTPFWSVTCYCLDTHAPISFLFSWIPVLLLFPPCVWDPIYWLLGLPCPMELLTCLFLFLSFYISPASKTPVMSSDSLDSCMTSRLPLNLIGHIPTLGITCSISALE